MTSARRPARPPLQEARHEPTSAPLPSVDLWVGSYTAHSGGTGGGIGTLHVDAGVPGAAGLAAAAPSPSFLATHPTLPIVYAVEESLGAIAAFHVRGAGRLEPAGEAWEAGASACHVAVDGQGRFLVVSCWGDGQVLLYELDAHGMLCNRVAAPAAVDPHRSHQRSDAGDPRERPSRAHSALILPDGRIASTDLGFDLLRVWRHEPAAGLVADHEVVFHEGAEPRHLVRHPSGRILAVGEASATVFVLGEQADGCFAIESSTPATRNGVRRGPAAEISLGTDGRVAHVGIRGTNRIATLIVHDDGRRLEPVDDVDCGGETPRHHWEHGDLLLVANQASGSVAAFRLDARGVPVHLLGTTPVASPTFLLPFAVATG